MVNSSPVRDNVHAVGSSPQTRRRKCRRTTQAFCCEQTFQVAVASVAILILLGLFGVFVSNPYGLGELKSVEYVYPTGPSETHPQLVLITHDDWVDKKSTKLLSTLTKKQVQHNGCPVPVTWFTLSGTGGGSDCAKIEERWEHGDEIAVHTMNHPELVKITEKEVQEEIIGCRSFITNCGIPAKHVVGFRGPFLVSSPAVRRTLHREKFLYDASLVQDIDDKRIGEKALKPYELTHGVNFDECALNYRPCDANESYAGLWEVPIWSLNYNGSSYSMDPGKDVQGNIGIAHPVYDVLKHNFDAVYNGNRAPFPIYVHSPWFDKNDSSTGTRKFIEYALSYPDVYFVTMRQLIEWTKISDRMQPSEFPPWLAARCGPLAKYS